MNNKDLINKINKAFQTIHNKQMNGSANFIVTSPEVAHSLRGLIDEPELKRKEREKKIKRILGSEK